MLATQSASGCHQVPRLLPRATKGPQARHQTQPSPISAAPATQSGGGCHQVRCLPRKRNVDVAKFHACHAKVTRRHARPRGPKRHQTQSSPINATPATQNDGGRHQVVCERRCETKLCVKMVCERWCVKDGVWKIVCDKDGLCDKDGVWQSCMLYVTKLCVKDGVRRRRRRRRTRRRTRPWGADQKTRAPHNFVGNNSPVKGISSILQGDDRRGCSPIGSK